MDLRQALLEFIAKDLDIGAHVDHEWWWWHDKVTEGLGKILERFPADYTSLNTLAEVTDQLAVYRSAIVVEMTGEYGYWMCKLCGSTWGHKDREFPEFPEWHYRPCRLARFSLVGDGTRAQVLRPLDAIDAPRA